MAKREYVKDLNAVKQLNAELQKEAKLLNDMEGAGKDLAASINEMAQSHAESGKYSQKNIDLAKKQSKIGSAMINVIKAQQKGDKLGIIAAKAKLKMSTIGTKNGDKQTKQLIQQYKTQQKQQQSSKMLNKITSKRVDMMGAMGKAGAALSEGLGEAGSMMVSAITNPLTFIISLMKMFDGFTDEVGKKFGALGVTKFKDQLYDANVEFTQMGMSSEDLFTSVEKLSTEFGIGAEKAIKMSGAVGDLSKSTGLAVDQSAQLVGYFSETMDLSAESATNLLKSAESLAVANGVAPNVVLKDIANSTEVFAKFGASGAKGLMRAAIQARKLGIDLNKVAGTADSLLDFQSSLNAEVEASIMLGRDVNLQKARELALSGDMEGLQEEMLQIIGDEAEWNKLNVLQRQSLAKAIGMNVTDLDKMVRKEKEAVTLAGEMAKQDLSSIIPEESMGEMAKFLNDMKGELMLLAKEIGPDLLQVFRDVAKPVAEMFKTFVLWVKKINESIGIANLLKAAFAGMIAKSIISLGIQVGIAYAKGAGSLGPGALVALAAAPLAVAAIVAGLVATAKSAGDIMSPAKGKTMVSTKEGGLYEMSKNDDFIAAPGLLSGPGGGGGGGNAAISSLKNENKLMRQEIQGLRKDLIEFFGPGGNVARDIGGRVGDEIVDMRF